MLASVILAAEVTAGPPPEPPVIAVPAVHALALLTVTRLAEAYLYPDPFADTKPSRIAGHYGEAFTRPPLFDPDRRAFEWDGDPWPINVIGHALMGSEMYVRARACHLGVLGSLTFTAAGTVIWEYVFEGSGVRPSALDLVYTPLAGLALGEARFQAWRAADGIHARGLRAAVRGLFDPFGELERGALRTRC